MIRMLRKMGDTMGVKYSFRMRCKIFSFSLNDYGSYVFIEESYKGRNFTISLEAEGCKWLSRPFLQMMEVRQDDKFLRTYRMLATG